MKKLSNPSTSVQILTGITMLVGLSEGAQATPLPSETQLFGVIASTAGTGDDASGSGSFSDTDERSFSLFDTLAGTRELTGVKFTWEQDNLESAEVNASAQVTSNEQSADINNVDVSATFTIDLLLSGSTTIFSQGLSDMDDCEALGGGKTCNASASASAVLAGMHSPGTLEIFELDGGGMFGIDLNIINGLASYSAIGDVNEASWISITSSWDGHFTVDYEFREIPAQVPEPATLLLFGAGLAGLGAARKWRKISVS